MKICNVCRESKPFTEFFRCKAFNDGFDYTCKECSKARTKAWAEKNGQRVREIKRESARKNYDPTRKALGFSRWYVKSKDNGAYARMVVRGSARRAIDKRAMPAWANEFFMAEIYDLAHRRTKVTGFLWHADHVIPLRSDLVCGLHVEQNLACIPAVANRSKNNRSWPNMPGNN